MAPGARPRVAASWLCAASQGRSVGSGASAMCQAGVGLLRARNPAPGGDSNSGRRLARGVAAASEVCGRSLIRMRLGWDIAVLSVLAWLFQFLDFGVALSSCPDLG